MAKKATGKAALGNPKAARKRRPKAKAPASARARKSGAAQDSVGDAFVKLLQSPLAAELVAVAATAALASLAEHGFAGVGAGSRGKRTGKAVKEAGKAAAAAVGRRLGTEIDEIRKASKTAKAGAKK